MRNRRRNPVVHYIKRLFGSFVASFQGIGGLFFSPRIKRRRNADFENAGNESSAPPPPDPKSTAKINRATRERDLEVLNAIRMENRMMRRNDAEAQEYRKAKEVDNVQVSRGEVINHLAAMQRKAAEKKKSDSQRQTVNGAPTDPTSEAGSEPKSPGAPDQNGAGDSSGLAHRNGATPPDTT